MILKGIVLKLVPSCSRICTWEIASSRTLRQRSRPCLRVGAPGVLCGYTVGAVHVGRTHYTGWMVAICATGAGLQQPSASFMLFSWIVLCWEICYPAQSWKAHPHRAVTQTRYNTGLRYAFQPRETWAVKYLTAKSNLLSKFIHELNQCM